MESQSVRKSATLDVEDGQDNLNAKKTGVTFKVADVEICQEKLKPSSYLDSASSRLGQKCESCFQGNSNMVGWGDMHGLMQAVHVAFCSHYPLVLSPDMIWLCIMQGFSIHVNENAEKLRKYFVEHEGKKELKVRRDDFVKGSPTNPWPEVFSEFSEKIKAEIGENTYDVITPDFTTTGPLEKAVTDIVLMEAMKSYFDYTMLTLCGIPSITLEGTTEDWIALREKAARLAHYDLEWWTTHLLPVLDQFIKASKGEVDKCFWTSIYKYGGGSGGPYISGWIVTLFPYVCCPSRQPPLPSGQRPSDFVVNKFLSRWSEFGAFHGLNTEHFTSGLSTAPFTWQYLEQEFKMKFIGGFMGVSQDTVSMALRPELGWAVTDEKNERIDM